MSKQREVVNIALSILFLGLGFLSMWLAKAWFGLQGEAVYAVLLLSPLVVYTILSGRLSELKAGGLEAKFASIASQTVEITAETVEPSIDEMSIVTKGGVRELRSQFQSLDESHPIILTLILGRSGYYARSALVEYMDALLQYPSFRFAVILDQDNCFVAYLPSWTMWQILRKEALGEELIAIINGGRLRDLQAFPGVVTRTITTSTNNLDALREMTSQNLEALVVIDAKKQLKGIVLREQILSKLFLGLSK